MAIIYTDCNEANSFIPNNTDSCLNANQFEKWNSVIQHASQMNYNDMLIETIGREKRERERKKKNNNRHSHPPHHHQHYHCHHQFLHLSL